MSLMTLHQVVTWCSKNPLLGSCSSASVVPVLLEMANCDVAVLNLLVIFEDVLTRIPNGIDFLQTIL